MATLESFWLTMAVHLWQTAVFVVLLAVVALALRRTSARLLSTLYWIGILKLLLPLPLLGPWCDRLLTLAGASLAGATNADAGWSAVTVLMYPVRLDAVAAGAAQWPPSLVIAVTAVWLTGLATIVVRRMRATARNSRDMKLRLPGSTLHATIAAADLEPEQVRIGPDTTCTHVRGGLRPVVVLPATIADRLDADELLAVLLHERAHLERRDPLRYALLAAVRTLFWFYPPAWWLTARILETTEMACDEAVLRAGLPAATYCRSLARTLILQPVRPAVSPVAILGHRVSFLRRRLERIRSARRFESMLSHRLTVAAAGLIALAVSLLPIAPTSSLHAGDSVRTVDRNLDELAEAELPVRLNFTEVRLDKLFESLATSSGIEFRVHPELAALPITVKTNKIPLQRALQHVAVVAGLRYEVVDRTTVAVERLSLADDEGVTMPVLIPESRVMPDYPEEARVEKINGNVVLQAMIDRSGNVGDIVVLNSKPAEFEPFHKSAMDAVRHWRYQPATKDGEPVDVLFNIVVNFHLE